MRRLQLSRFACFVSVSLTVPRDKHLEEMGSELGGSFGAGSVGLTRPPPGRNNTQPNGGKEPKPKKVKTEAQEAQLAFWLALVLHHVLHPGEQHGQQVPHRIRVPAEPAEPGH